MVENNHEASENENISVALATFNGEHFIEEQLESIINQLTLGDEIIVSDDGSTDKTLDIIKKYQKECSFIKLLKNESHHGVIGNFENALTHCKNKYIFLSDQDDIWSPNKKKSVISLLKNGSTLVLHNANILNESTSSIENYDMYKKLGFSTNIISVLLKNPYIGCCMAFKKELLDVCLPFPKENLINIHDWWIGLCAILTGKCSYSNEKLITYRIHSNNTLGFHKTSFLFKIKKRLLMISCLIKFRRRFK